MADNDALNALIRAGFRPRQANAMLAAFAQVETTPAPGGGSGGSGGPSISALLTPGASAQVALGADRRADFTGWSASNLQGTAADLAISSAAGQKGFDFAAGWYQVLFQFWMGFTAGVDPLPQVATFEWETYAGYSLSQDIALTPSPNNSNGSTTRGAYGALGSILTPAYYTPGTEVTGGGQGGSTVRLLWDGDATLTSGTGGQARFAVQGIVTKLS